MIFRQLLLLACILGVVAFSGCSGGGGSGSVAGNGGIEGTGAPVASMGSVTAFGSIFVNGVEYETNGADISINSVTSQPEDSLELGMVVLVRGNLNSNGTTGEATSVVFDQNLQGPIGDVDNTGDSLILTVLGVEVEVNDDTVLQNIEFADLTAGLVISVSGFTGADNTLVASRIEKVSDGHTNGEQVEVEGTVSNLTADQFDIGSQQVRHSGANVVPASATLAEGATVEVKGSAFDGDVLIATQIKIKSNNPGFEDGDGVELEGIVSNFTSSADFTVNGVSVNASNADFNKGDSDDLANGVRVEVKGEIDSDNVLQATKVTIKKVPSNKLRAQAANVDGDNNTLTLLGVTVVTDSQTVFQDTGSNRLKYFSFEDIEESDWIDVRGTFLDSNGALIASRLTRRNDAGLLVKGVVSAKTSDTLTIMGITVDTTDVDASGVNIGDTVVAEGLTAGANSMRADSLTVDD
ncbi:DUF5666 domain-containing protein [Hahella ganghwensis]|uniref:DUF5666 domain-containing protein n=1 Tax=Hahella ganghwensis TaxID=286420 RepID=UPI0003689B1C|nr:DUF5666 domain-containing protein [Hahella ganghwensis]